MGNMYGNSVMQWSLFVGCKFECVYCIPSFQKQMKRRKNKCKDCYEYKPHFHEERLTDSLPLTPPGTFIWVCSSSDISFMKRSDLERVFARIREFPDRTFFIQTKNPKALQGIEIPNNVLIGITLETNRDEGYAEISNAPLPSVRFEDAKDLRVDVITIEPVLEFDLEILLSWIDILAPKVVYIGYDTKNCHLNEPELAKVKSLIRKLKVFTIVKPKLLRERWNHPKGRRLDQFFRRR